MTSLPEPRAEERAKSPHTPDIDECKAIVAGRIAGRLREMLDVFEWPDGFVFWVAGGAMIREGNDVDLFCPVEWPIKIEGPKVRIESRTTNAITAKIGDGVFQFCKYAKPTLGELITAFDFAHCQIGCVVEVKHGFFNVSDVQWTDAFVLSRATATTWFTGSEFPLSSLIRTQKYYKTGMLTRGAGIRAVIDILVAVIERGFNGYNDFKDQLDAVDLGLLPEQLEDVDRASLIRLFTLLNKAVSP